METGELIQSGVGAVVGFLLAQLVNVAALMWEWSRRPRLVIELPQGNARILSHSAEVRRGEYLREEIYGFSVRNEGLRVAIGVRFQLIKVEHRRSGQDEFREISDQAYELNLYNGAGSSSGAGSVMLVPGAAALVKLASWREDYEPIFPAVIGLPDYYEESTSGSDEFRFTVVAFDGNGSYVTEIVTIEQ